MICAHTTSTALHTAIQKKMDAKAAFIRWHALHRKCSQTGYRAFLTHLDQVIRTARALGRAEAHARKRNP